MGIFDFFRSVRNKLLNQTARPDRTLRLKRNDPCHCGSRLKYKKCHLESDEKQELAEIDAIRIAKNNDITAEGYSPSEIGISQRGFDKLRETAKSGKND